MAPEGYPILSSYPTPTLMHHTEPLTGQPLYNSRHVTQGQRQRWPVLEQAFGSARRKATCLWESGPDTSSGLKSVLGPSWPRWRRRGVDHDGDYETAGPPSYPSSVSPVPQYVKPPERHPWWPGAPPLQRVSILNIWRTLPNYWDRQKIWNWCSETLSKSWIRPVQAVRLRNTQRVAIRLGKTETAFKTLVKELETTIIRNQLLL